MSGIVGIINLDGEPIDPHLLGRMTDFMAFRGPDDRQIWIEGNVGFGHTMLRTTWEAEYEQQPFTLDRQVWIVADARIDDRETLAEKLAIPFQPLRGAASLKRAGLVTDVEFILQAYLKWGEACVEHLLGDFVFAIWDGRSKRLFCGRDQFGVKPFYYARKHQAFLFASSVDALRHHPLVTNELNEEAIGDFLLFAHNQNQTTTIYRDIQRIPPAHRLILTNDRVQIERYWNFPTNGEIYYRNDADYVDHYRDIFSTAVKDRLRSNKISISMSGGMDSSSIAAMAVRHLAPSYGNSAIAAFTINAGNLLPDDREDYYTTIVAESLKISLNYFSIEPYQPYERSDTPELYCQQPLDDYKLAAWVDYLKNIREHSRILLTGHGGDLVFIGSNLYYISLLKRGKIGHFCRDALNHVIGNNSMRGLGLRSGFRLLLGQQIGYKFAYPDWIESQFAVRNSLPEKYASFYQTAYDFSSPHPCAYECLSQSHWSESFESEYYLDTGIETRNPFFDTRLIEFMFAINTGWWGLNKKILRDSMSSILPEIITTRPKTPVAGNLILEKFKHFQPADRFVDPQNIISAYIDLKSYHSYLEKFKSSGSIDYYSLSTPLSLEAWLHNQDRERHFDNSS
jgi:asparagine synthase (glutamine-hydrolysing)